MTTLSPLGSFLHQTSLGKQCPFAEAYASAEAAWFNGDYLAAERALRDILPTTKTQRADHALLHARTLLRSGDYEQSLVILNEMSTAPGDIDRLATSLMLQGSALTKLGRFEEGEGLLRQARAVTGAHRTIVAETALQTALLAYVQRKPEDKTKLAECRSWALKAVSAGSDIVLARAQELIGYVNVAEEKYGQALKSFRQALVTLKSSSHRDRLLQANIVHVLASLAFERLEIEVLDSSLQAASELAWTEDLGSARFQVLQNIGWLAFAAGETHVAWRHFIAARDAVTTDSAYHAMALLNLAFLHRSVGDASAARWHLDLASELIADVKWDNLDADHRATFLEWVAEASRQGIAVPETSIDAFEKSRDAEGSKSFARGDRRFRALQLTARGLAVAARNVPRGVKLLTSALEIWVAVGYRFRAATTALELYALTNQPQHLDVARLQTRALRQGWLRDQVSKISRMESRGFATLSVAERRVLSEILLGKSTAVIARGSARSGQTIKNQTVSIFEKLGVGSRSELIVLCSKMQKW